MNAFRLTAVVMLSLNAGALLAMPRIPANDDEIVQRLPYRLDATARALALQIFPSPEPFLSADAALAANLFNHTGRRSRSLADCMIAAVAIRCGAKLATVNLNDFRPLVTHGLILA